MSIATPSANISCSANRPARLLLGVFGEIAPHRGENPLNPPDERALIERRATWQRPSWTLGVSCGYAAW
jgi:hypothetical protein